MSKLIVNEIEKYDAGQLTITTGTNVSMGGALTVSGNLAVDTNTLYVDAANNRVGIGIVPSAWSFTALQIKNSAFWSTGSDLGVNANSYYDGSAYRYVGNAAASRVYHNTDGSIAWSNAPSGTAGNAITFEERMRIDSSGNVGIGVVPSANVGNLQIGGSAQSSLFAQQGTDTVRAGVRAAGRTGIVFDSTDSTYTNRMWYIDNVGSSGKLIIGRNGLDVATFDNSGNVGIGAVPTRTLQVHEASATSSAIKISNSTTGATVNDGFDLVVDSVGNAYLAQKEALPLIFLTSDTEKMRIDSSGDIGIGTTDGDIFGRFYARTVGIKTTSGIAKLQIDGSSYSGIDLGQSGTRYSEINCSSTALNIATIANIPIVFGTGTSATERMRIDSSGTTHIQTTKAFGSQTAGLRLQTVPTGTNFADGAWQTIVFGNETIANGYLGQLSVVQENASASTASSMRFYTNNGGGNAATQERMRINSNGQVLIGGSATPTLTSSKLFISRGDQYGLGIWASGATNASHIISSEDNLILGSAGSERMRIASNGLVTINSLITLTTANAANVYAGTTSGNLYRSTSSIKYKTDVVDYDKGLDVIDNLRPVYYKGINDGDSVFAGLIAEEVNDLGLTEFVQLDENGEPDALSYQNMVALLIKGIQELRVEVESLKSQLNA